MMAKFKIGDRVRVLPRDKALAFSGHGATAGKEYTVKAVRGEARDNIDTELWSFFDHEIELTPPTTIEPGKHYRTRSGKPTGRVTVGDAGFEAVVDGCVRIFDKAGGAVHGEDDIVAAWVPKVGERVRYDDGTIAGEGAIYSENHYEEDVNYYQWLVEVAPEDREFAYFVNESCRKFAASDLEPLPVAAPQPAAQEPAAPTLKIEAGRYYRTRDGRRVGPMRDTGGGQDHWTADETAIDLPYWHDCGAHWKGRESSTDLIAEWPETTNVGAQVDTLAEEYGPAPASNDNAAKPKFKVGDRVRLVVDDGNSAKVGATGVVGPREEFGMFVDIIWDENELRNRQMNGGYFKSSFEHLTTPTAPISAIVALIENGQPKPAAIPHVHANQAAAEREANRLAGVHKGKQFGVFVLTTTAEEAAPTYRHEWQRLAVAGKKIDAIRELRGLTGMQLKPAKDVVEHFTAYPYGQAA